MPRIFHSCRYLTPLLLLALLLCGVSKTEARDLLVVGDTRLRPVVQVIAGVKQEVSARVLVYTPAEVRGKLDKVIRQHRIQTVIVLGRESIREALSLPSSVTVLYALVIMPPEIDRPNTAGLYMGTPIRKYVEMIATYLPEIKRISVIATPKVLALLDSDSSPQITAYKVGNTFDFIDTVKGIKASDALLLLPDISLMTKTVVKESYLFSFRHRVPLLGISKKHVRQGALFALEFNPERVGRQLGIMAQASFAGQDVGHGQASPSQYFNLYVNRETARKMGVTIPPEMLKLADTVYP